MFRHVVMFTWKDGVGDDAVAAVSAGLDELPVKIDVIRSFAHGPDAGINAGNHHYVVVADFDSADDYVVYRDHPEHRAFIDTVLVPSLGARAAVQYQL
jgi:hypothetical protein